MLTTTGMLATRGDDMLKADRVVTTTCPYCGVGCQIDLFLKDNIIYRADGRFDNDVNRGSLCVKGRFGYDFVHAPDRLKVPLAKADDGSFYEITWDEAINKVARNLDQVRQKHGPDSVAFLTSAKCSNEENYLLQKLARGVVGTNNIDHCARL
jgi:predicted molibdopterin-dependent oxidoreductase YjgC